MLHMLDPYVPLFSNTFQMLDFGILVSLPESKPKLDSGKPMIAGEPMIASTGMVVLVLRF